MTDATGPGPITQDGCAVELYRRLSAGDEPTIIGSALPVGATILELGAGAGRVTQPLMRAGFKITAVDSSTEMLEAITYAETVTSSIETLDLGRTFDAVVLGSNLVNTPDDTQRQAFLRTCRRHMRKDSISLIEVYVPERVRAAKTGSLGHSDGVCCYLEDLQQRGALFRATIAYEAQDARWTQTFTAKLLNEWDLTRELEQADLAFQKWRNDSKSWFSARHR